MQRPYSDIISRLRAANLRPTRQRMALAKRLFEGPTRHVTAESLHAEVREAKMPVSLATVYNTLHQFARAGLVREIVVDSERLYFDTNISAHHHFFHEESGHLEDIPAGQVEISGLPRPPQGTEITRVDVVVKVSG